MRNLNCVLIPYLALAILGSACSDDEIDSDEQARRAYLGLDKSIEKSLKLGMDGFNMAQNATIPDQTTTGDAAGTLLITGKVDQGSSDNKGLRLYIGMVDYDDGEIVINEDGDTIRVAYSTSTVQDEQPYLDLDLRNIPSGTMEGTLTSGTSLKGVYHLSGDLEATVELDLTLSGALMQGTDATVQRVPGSTHVTGTAISGDGAYTIDLTI